MKPFTLSVPEVKLRGMKALSRELGAAGMAQFMQQFSKGQGDYSKDRHRLWAGVSVQEVFAAIKKMG